MPCPFFEPTRVASDPKAAHARLPLLAEYDGVCHAGLEPVGIVPEWRFGGCNHGHERERCPRFRSSQEAIVRRFDVQEQTESSLSVLVLEEVDYVPVRWRRVQFSKSRNEVIDPSDDACEVAQIRAFCSTYLQRFA